MLRRHRELDRIDRYAAVRHLRLSQHIVAVVQALEGERALGLRFHRLDGLQAAAILHLLQLERRALQRLAALIHLVHDHLVRERDHRVFLGFLGLLARLLLAGVLVGLHLRAVAVLQLRRVHIALAAQDRILVQDRREFNLHRLAVQARRQLAVVLAFGLLRLPGQRQIELLRALLGQRVLRRRLAIHLHAGDLIEGQALLHLVVEGDMVLHIIRYVVRQLRGQLVRHGVADVVVRRILPVAGLAGRVVGVLDLLLEGRLLRQLILHQQHGLAVLVGGGAAVRAHLALLIDREGRVARQLVAVRRHGLAQRVGLAGLQAGHLVGLLGGGPLLDHIAILVDDLDRRALQLLAVGHVGLLHLHDGHRVFHQQHAALDLRVRAGNNALLVDLEARVASHRVAQRRHSLAQRVGLTRLQDALHLVGFLGGGPLGNYRAVLVDDLDVRARQFLAMVAHVHLAHLHRGGLVGEGHLIAGLVRRRDDLALAVVRQGNGDGLDLGVVDDGLVAALDLTDGVGDRAVLHVVQRVVDRVEGHAAVSGVGLALQLIAVGALQDEGELPSRQRLVALQHLLRGEGDIAARGVAVVEHSLLDFRRAFVTRDGALAVGVVTQGPAVVFLLGHFIAHAVRQAGRGLLIAVLQRERRHAVSEVHLTISAIDVRRYIRAVLQRHRELELLVRLGDGGLVNLLLHHQVAMRVLVGEGQLRSGLLLLHFQFAVALVRHTHVDVLSGIILHVLHTAGLGNNVGEVRAGIALQV